MVTSAKRMLARLRRQRSSPPSAATWNAQYDSGRWAYLGELRERARFCVLTGYMTHFKPGGSILDIGCGAGVLYEHMQPLGYARYVGVDLSSSAIAQIRSHDERSRFFAADGEHYVPEGSFDIAVFNEVLYFFQDARSAVQRYARCLSTGGVILVSTCTAFEGGIDMLDGLKGAFQVLDETRVTHGSNPWSWLITALAP
jgi:2-polyprenyl-3-methyl-5-hydroxy-6-metoxy-1,4-benzoquinol methylase